MSVSPLRPACGSASPASVFLRVAPLCTLLWACSQDRPLPLGGADGASLEIALVSSTLAPRPGDSVVIAIATPDRGTPPLAALQGVVHFDPARLRYLGQVPRVDAEVDVINDAAAASGRLGVLSYTSGQLPSQSATLVFEVRAPDITRGLHYQLTLAATADLQSIAKAHFTGVEERQGLPAPAESRRLTEAAWAALLGYPALPVRGQVSGEYRQDLRYGDATLDGAVNTLDAFYVANIAVGNFPLIVGTDAPPRDAVVAGNVYPLNIPGLGGLGDPVPPGIESTGGRLLNALDAVVIARESVGIDYPIAGELIPGRGAPATTRIPVSGTLSGAVVWTQGSIYSLQGTVTVPAGASLTIERGVRVEGASGGSGIVVQPGGLLTADGTALEPVSFTCVSFEGCNSAISWTGSYTTNPTENAGRLQYVRVDGFSIGMWLTNLGSGTLLDYVQVAGRPGQPISAAFAINNGAVGLKHIVLGPEIAGPAISITGWSGKAQFIVMRPRTVASGWLLHAILPSATPPQIYNVTSAALPGSSAGGFPRFSAGANGIIRNLLLYQTGDALQIEDAATCNEIVQGRLQIQNSLFLGLADPGNPDVDPSPCGGYTSPDVEAQFLQAAPQSNRYLAGASPAAQQLVAPDEPTLWDLRPTAGSLAISGAATPPADGFFDPTATYVGAVEPVSAALGNPPWYAGWILSNFGAGPVPSPAGVTGTLSSSLGGPLTGVTLSTATGYQGQSDANGQYMVAGFPGGSVTLNFSTLPAGCTDPGPQTLTVPAGTLDTLDLTLTCLPVPTTGTLSGAVSSPSLGALSGISVLVTPPGSATTTSGSGGYSIAGLPPGAVTVSLDGLPAFCTAPAPQGASITAGATSTVNFTVSCTPPPADGSLLVLTYMCGNTFRVRNPNYAVMPVTWDVYGTAESGTLSLPARTVGLPYTETFFTTTNNGTVRLFYNASQVQVKANGGIACNAAIIGSVSSPELGPLAGVAVTNGSATAVTSANGGYTLPGAAGPVTIGVSGAPATCAAGAAQQVTVPANGTVTANWALACPVPGGAFAVDVNVGSGTVTVQRIGTGRVTTNSLLGSDAVSIGIANFYASPVGAYTPGRVRVWFDLTLTSTLNGVALGTPTFPTPPPAASGVFVFPYSATGFTVVGGIVNVLPNTGLITASVDWNGNALPDQPVAPALPGAGGNPWSWFNDPVCGGGTAGGGDCYRYENYPAIPVHGTTAPRRVGFDLDPSIGQFRAYLVVAADLM